MKTSTKILLAVVLVVMVISPLYLLRGAEFAGADGEAETAITEIKPEYEPWFSPIMEPASGEIESLLFALQAAIGAGVIFYYLGYKRGQKSEHHR
ncbi:MAG: energy-coupling factor ABC transporter substrate-binding protein [Tissierellia bacterium]|nr:energy-coupling factor ABC transporter substrate-binding protein [Tissierellia bacterium]